MELAEGRDSSGWLRSGSLSSITAFSSLLPCMGMFPSSASASASSVVCRLLGLTSVAMQNASSCSCMMEPILLIQPSSFEQTPTPQQSRFHLKAETTAISLGICVIPKTGETQSKDPGSRFFFLTWSDERGMMLSLRVCEFSTTTTRNTSGVHTYRQRARTRSSFNFTESAEFGRKAQHTPEASRMWP